MGALYYTVLLLSRGIRSNESSQRLASMQSQPSNEQPCIEHMGTRACRRSAKRLRQASWDPLCMGASGIERMHSWDRPLCARVLRQTTWAGGDARLKYDLAP